MPSPNWDKIYQNGREYPLVNEVWLNRILGHIETADKFPETALDIGCGTGDFVVKLAQRNIHTTGLDLSAVALDKAKKRANDNEVSDKVEFIKANIEEIDQEELPSQVDLAVSKLAYAFIEDKKSFLQKIKGLLCEGGWFIISTPVLVSGDEIKYSQRMKGISVPFTEANELLSSAFSNLNIFHKNYFEETGLEVTYILQK